MTRFSDLVRMYLNRYDVELVAQYPSEDGYVWSHREYPCDWAEMWSTDRLFHCRVRSIKPWVNPRFKDSKNPDVFGTRMVLYVTLATD